MFIMRDLVTIDKRLSGLMRTGISRADCEDCSTAEIDMVEWWGPAWTTSTTARLEQAAGVWSSMEVEIIAGAEEDHA